jgi:hypothetical protein
MMGTLMDDYEEGVWHRQDDLLFTVQRTGWLQKGKPLMGNRLMVRIDRVKGVSDEEYEETIASIHDFLKSQPSRDSDNA